MVFGFLVFFRLVGRNINLFGSEGAYDDAVGCAALAGDVAVWEKDWLAAAFLEVERDGKCAQIDELAFVVFHIGWI